MITPVLSLANLKHTKQVCQELNSISKIAFYDPHEKPHPFFQSVPRCSAWPFVLKHRWNLEAWHDPKSKTVEEYRTLRAAKEPSEPSQDHREDQQHLGGSTFGRFFLKGPVAWETSYAHFFSHKKKLKGNDLQLEVLTQRSCLQIRKNVSFLRAQHQTPLKEKVWFLKLREFGYGF